MKLEMQSIRFTDPLAWRPRQIRRFFLRVPAPILVVSFFLLGAPATRGAQTPSTNGPRQADPMEVVEGYLRENLAALRLTEEDLLERLLSDRYVTRRTGMTHIYFRQRLEGIEVFNAVLNLNVTRDGRVLHVGNRFISHLRGAVNTRHAVLSAAEAVERAAAELGLTPPPGLSPVGPARGPDRAVEFRGETLSLRDIPVKLMYLPREPGEVRLVWDVQIQPDDQHYWQVAVDAVDGRILRRADRVQHDSYRVYAWPAESPNHVASPLPLPPADGRTFVSGTAADPIASPFGWHDLDGLAGADTANTTGNNVFGQTDLTGANVLTPLDHQPGSATRDFDFPLDLTREPADYRDATVTNLFYWNNVIHDIHYLYGFDEASGNFQQNNYPLLGRGGVGNDAVQADAQDGSGTNNANMLTLPEGTPPRMQMFVWNARPVVQVNSGANAGDSYASTQAAFGEPLDAAGVTGDVRLVDDGVGTRSDACESLPAGQLAGRIALIDRGTCEFELKVKNAEDAGAIGAIVANNQGDELVIMGPGMVPRLATIPSVFIGQTDGQTIQNALQAGSVNATMRKVGADRDSDLDNGVIIHEYGHGVSIRLTGGPLLVTCLEGDQQGGEGWSDFWALALTQRAGADGAEPRGIGTYLSFEDPPAFGRGIRPFPYSTDMAVNPQTYGDLAEGGLTVPHGIGSVWATTLWEMYWALVNGVPELGLPGSGFRENLYDLSGDLAGNQIALQLVMEGLKMQPCEPTFLDARDAILAADRDGFDGDGDGRGDHECHIWWAFAKRGEGVTALEGDRDILGFTTLDVTESFAIPSECVPGPCLVPPTFAGADGVVSNTDGSCSLTVGWSAADNNCGSDPATYSVYRSTDPGFLPDPGTLLASGLTGTSFEDSAVESGVRYYYIVRATDHLGNTDPNLVRRSEVPVGTLSPGGSFADDAGDTGRERFSPGPAPNNTWTVRPSGGVGNSRVYATTAAGNYADRSCLTLESGTVYLGPNPTLTFRTKYDIEPGWDGGIVEVSTAAGGFANWTKLDTITYPGVRHGALTVTACNNPGLRTGQPVFTGTSAGEYLSFSGSLQEFANQAVRIRFVLGSDDATNDLGWSVDEIEVDDVQEPGPCGLCGEIDDSDRAVDYRGGWHRVDDAAASGGGYHRRLGSKQQGNRSTPAARLTFEGDKVTYLFARTAIGGTADIYIDGAFRETLSYAPGPEPTSRTYSGLGPGTHTLLIEHRSGAAYVDGFGFACAQGAGPDAAAAEFHSETLAGPASASEGPVIVRSFEIGFDDVEVSVVVEGSLLPLTVNLLDPDGNLVASGAALIEGLTATGLDAAVNAPGTYRVQVVNAPGGFETVGISVARTVRNR